MKIAVRDQMLQLRKQNPDMPCAAMARRIGVSRQHIYQLMTEMGMGLGKSGRPKRPKLENWKNWRSEYQCWWNMINRCINPKNKMYRWYGARGIAVDREWANSFDAFLGDMGPRPSRKHSIDRIDNDGDYEPSNCRWATSRQQADNQRPRWNPDERPRLDQCRPIWHDKSIAHWQDALDKINAMGLRPVSRSWCYRKMGSRF